MLRRRFLLISLSLVAGAASAATMLDTKWTKAAEQAYEATATTHPIRLPEFRIYDSRHRLILDDFGMKPGTVARTVGDAMRRDVPMAGPSYAQTLSVLETRDGKPAASARLTAKFVIVDYWADWCAPCKVLGAELEKWAGQQPAGSIQLIRAETDPLAAARARGAVIRHYKKGPDGKLVEIME
jgi:thiol-disulfide isomerase/thioredoxin